jgi:hypothetical protein
MPIETVIALLAALGFGGLLGNILTRHYESQKQTNEHDIKIFAQSNEILGEQKLSDIAHFHLLGDHSIVNDDFFQLARWCDFFEQVSNQYLDKKINKENRKLLDDLRQLVNFIATNFFTIRGQNSSNNSQYLKPDWNPDRGDDPSPEKIAKYDVYAKELTELTRKALQQYTQYRFVIKKKLRT